jgi:hypothetical protein
MSHGALLILRSNNVQISYSLKRGHQRFQSRRRDTVIVGKKNQRHTIILSDYSGQHMQKNFQLNEKTLSAP